MRRRLTAFIMALVLCFLLSSCGSAGQVYTDYVQAIMDCTYYGDTGQYIQFTECEEADAKSIHEDEVAYVRSMLCYKATVKESCLDAQTKAGYDALAEELLSRVRYRILPAIRSGSGYHVEISVEPLDFWERPSEMLTKIYSRNFSERFYKAPADSAELAALEAEWGKRALSVLERAAASSGYQNARNTSIEITVDALGHYTIPGQSWQALDALLLGLNETD